MRNSLVEEILAPVDLPLAYRKFVPYKNKPVPSPPYMIYAILRETASGADYCNLIKRLTVTLELYCVDKDEEHEAAIESCLVGYEWDKEEDFIESEHLYVTTYEFEIIQTRRD